MPLEIALGNIGSTVCILSFIYLITFLWILYTETKRLLFNITVERGKL
jgi:hypothetical protein